MQQEARQTVKLSKQTIEVLRNFSAINKSILIDPGKFVETMSVNKNIIAASDIREGIPEQMAIYDLPLFLGALSLFKSPTLFFPDNKKVVIYDEDTKGKTTFSTVTPRSSVESLSLILTSLILSCSLTCHSRIWSN